MPCYAPLKAFQVADGRIVFAERGDVCRVLSLACGQCIGCRLERSRGWAVRCMHEAQMHAKSVFITLTYDDAHFPSQNGSLVYEDFRLFLRRLRKKLGKVRFFMCGEYGSQRDRPHFHACLFGCDFPDKVYFRTLDSGCRIYRSAILESLWPYGYSSIGDVTFESAAYIARYICKKVTGDLAATHYMRVSSSTGEVFHLTPEFARMSLKPGIGAKWFEKYGSEVFPADRVVMRGREMKPPKYYKRLIKGTFLSDDMDFQRMQRAAAFVDDCTEERLVTREIVARARLSFKPRGLE